MTFATTLLALAAGALAAVPAQDTRPEAATIRVYVTDSESWELRGGWSADESGGSGFLQGGARPQTAEIMKTFRQRCPAVTVTSQLDRADYVVLLDHEGGKGLIRRDNKVAVFNREGDLMHAGSTRALGNAVKDACEAIGATDSD